MRSHSSTSRSTLATSLNPDGPVPTLERGAGKSHALYQNYYLLELTVWLIRYTP